MGAPRSCTTPYTRNIILENTFLLFFGFEWIWWICESDTLASTMAASAFCLLLNNIGIVNFGLGASVSDAIEATKKKKKRATTKVKRKLTKSNESDAARAELGCARVIVPNINKNRTMCFHYYDYLMAWWRLHEIRLHVRARLRLVAD